VCVWYTTGVKSIYTVILCPLFCHISASKIIVENLSMFPNGVEDDPLNPLIISTLTA
jgi:hypothetical protein